MKLIIKKIIKESKEDKFYEKISKIIDKPYIKDLESMGIYDEDSHKKILSYTFNDNVDILYEKDHTGNYDIIINDSKGREIYFEGYGTNFWEKRERDSNGNILYYENSEGSWIKIEYDSEGNEIYFEDSDGRTSHNY